VRESSHSQEHDELDPACEAANDSSAQSRSEPLPWDDSSCDPPNYDEVVYWSPVESDSDMGESSKISDSMARVIKEAFSKMLPTEKRKNVKRKFPHPDSVHTKCPKLDPPIRSKLPKQAKDADENLVRLKSKVLNMASPLVSLLESTRRGVLTPKDAAETAQQALKLLGNASATISADRCQKGSHYLNRELTPLVKKQATFTDAAPLLFGKGFDKQAKEHLDTLRSFHRSFSSGEANQFFCRPSMSRGGGNNQGNR